MRFFLMAALLLVTTPLWADSTPRTSLIVDALTAERLSDEARAMIYAHDIAGFDRAIRAAHAADLAAMGDQNRQRALFGPFGSTDARIEAFTADWLAAEPNSPYAQIARAWHLRAMGWAIRGLELRRYVYPQAMAEMDKLHDAGLVLAMQARDAAPDMVAASDAVIRLGQTRGMADSAEAELARIMDIAPNHGSLVRTANALSPRWGGSTQGLDRICADHALKLPDVPAYTPDICTVEMYLAGQVTGPALGWVWSQLDTLPDHPNLARARLERAMWGDGAVEDRIALLTAFLANSDYDDGMVMETASAVDRINRVAGNGAAEIQPTLTAGYVAWLTERLNQSPADPGLLQEYIGYTIVPFGPETPTPAEKTAVLRRALAIAPYNAEALERLTFIQTDGNRMADYQQALPTMANTIVYSNYNTKHLSSFASTWRYAYVVGPDSPMQNAPGTQTPETLKAFDAAVSCPFVRVMRVLEYICAGPQGDADECPVSDLITDHDAEALDHIAARGVCADERTGPIESLAYTPVVPLP